MHIQLASVIYRSLWVFLTIGLFGTSTSCLAASTLADKIQPLIERHRGDVSVAIRNLTTGETFRYQDTTPMPTASMIKFPVMVEAYRQIEEGKLKGNQPLTLTDEDKVPGSGILTPHFSAGMRLTLIDAIHLMIVYSDNTATNLVLDQIGLDAPNRLMADLGYPQTRIHAKVFRRDTSLAPGRSREFGLGSTTAAETIQLYEQLFRGKLAGEKYTLAMVNHLKQCADQNKLARLLPSSVKIAHKGGAVSRTRCDAGIIYAPNGPLAVCVMTRNNQDRSWNQSNHAETLCARIGQVAYLHFNPEPTNVQPPARATLQSGDSGRLVEDLQRTLNQRLKPNPGLSVDGDFGPNTRKAVLKFQSVHQLPATGIVNTATWKALGTLITQDDPVPSPNTVNRQRLPRNPADPLTGPPFVTCKAWAIADLRTGKLLWGHKENTSLDMASTTKIMTAYIVLQAASKAPELLNQTVTFSARADNTRGSTAAIRVGESLPAHELLYGLMLPSGNDASVALAEHFGNQVKANPSPGNRTAYEHFIARMNQVAQQLGMHNTRFANPHGLTAKDHHTTAADLARLAHQAMKLPLFRQYVSTRQHGCTLNSKSGYKRNVIWKNTNRLLATEGYLGVKTGTTTAAGACLVSAAQRNERQLIMVVLGSSSSDARYTDSRNLYRWAWNQLD